LTNNNSEEFMVINTLKDWQDILERGAIVLHETRLFKIFSMPDGKLWRAMPKWRRAWRFYVNAVDCPGMI
jgi:hypothetical protein